MADTTLLVVPVFLTAASNLQPLPTVCCLLRAIHGLLPLCLPSHRRSLLVARGDTSRANKAGLKTVLELRRSEMQSPVLIRSLDALRSRSGGSLCVGLHRYAFHVPSLRSGWEGWGSYRRGGGHRKTWDHLREEAHPPEVHARYSLVVLVLV